MRAARDEIKKRKRKTRYEYIDTVRPLTSADLAKINKAIRGDSRTGSEVGRVRSTGGGGARAGACDGHARAAGHGLALAVPCWRGGAVSDDCGVVPEVGERGGGEGGRVGAAAWRGTLSKH